MPDITFNKNWRGYLWYYAPLILWIVLILAASSGAGSMSSTSRIIRPLLLWLSPDISETTLLIVHGFVRKTGHFAGYFILGVFAARAFTANLNYNLRKAWFPAALLLIIVVATVDETNQSLLVSRTGSFYDVLLDTVGGLAALTIWLYGKRLTPMSVRDQERTVYETH